VSAELAHVVQQLIIAVQHLSAANRQGARLSPHEYAALQHLHRSEDGLTPSQLGERLGITTGSTTKLIDRLERRRLAARKRNRTDRRSLTVAPTATGRQIIARETTLIREQLDASATTLRTADQKAAIRYLETALNSLGHVPTEHATTQPRD